LFLAEHVAPTFEDICRAWVRKTYGRATDVVGPWWGLARHDLRRRKVRSTEEIDVVGARGTRVTVVGKCRWRRGAMPREVLDDLLEHKLPALAQAGVDVSSARVVLFSRGGFVQSLVQEARKGSVEQSMLSCSSRTWRPDRTPTPARAERARVSSARTGVSARRCIWNASVPSESEAARFSRVLRSRVSIAMGKPSGMARARGILAPGFAAMAALRVCQRPPAAHGPR
jgi:hypothetical protein